MVTHKAQLKAYAAAFEMIPNSIFFVKGLDHTYHMANAGLAKLCCVASETDVVGKATTDFFAPDYIEWCGELDKELVEGRSYERRLDRLYDARGDRHWTLYNRRSITFGNGERYILGVSHFLTVDPRLEQKYQRLQTVTEEIHTHMDRRWTLDMMAAIAGTSLPQLERDFLDVLDLRPMEYLNSARLNYAKDLIKGGGRLVDIAAQVGLSEQSAFSRFFKRMTGVTPSVYREGMAQL